MIKQYQHLLKEHNIKQSMSRKGNHIDNSVIENFFGSMDLVDQASNIQLFIADCPDGMFPINAASVDSQQLCLALYRKMLVAKHNVSLMVVCDREFVQIFLSQSTSYVN